MFFTRLKITLLSIIILFGFSMFLLYKLDFYVQNQSVAILSNQLVGTSDFVFNNTQTDTQTHIHNLTILNTLKNQSSLKELWISRTDKLNTELNKPTSSLRDIVERKVYVTKSPEFDISKFGNYNDKIARISVPIIANQSCITCHTSLKVGDIAGSMNAKYLLNDSIMAIYDTMKFELGSIILVASLILMFVMVLSIHSFTKLVYNIKMAIQSAIEGDYSIRIKSYGLGIFDEASKLTNRLLETLDKSITSVDIKIASIFVYKKTIYSNNPLIRLTELIGELTNLFLFKNKIETARHNKDVYKELQIVISRYIKYKYLIFAEIINNEIVSGYKVEDDTDIKIAIGDVRAIEKRFDAENFNVLFDDGKGCLFISTSIDKFHVIDLRFFVSNDIILYYSIALNSKKELLEKQNSVNRIYNYIREAKLIIKNIILVKNIEEASYLDPLTKAYNRLYLEKYSKDIEVKLKKHINFGVLMLDIDHFKKVNDTYGHAVGDAGIVMLTESVRKAIKPTDKLFRYGGEEFVVILEGYDIDETYKVAEKIRNIFAMTKKCSLMELNFSKSVSIGMSAMPDFSHNVWECVNQADLALYEAKENGRNRVIKYSLDLKNKNEKRKQKKEEDAIYEENNKQTNNKINDDEKEFLNSLKLNS